eukprot:gene26953-32566_t
MARNLALVLLWIFVFLPQSLFSFEFLTIPSLPRLKSLDKVAVKPFEKKSESLYFTGAGIYIWWQMGCAKYIRENCDIRILRDIPVVGASAGSITATMLLANGDFDKGAKLAEQLAYDYDLYSRDSGLYGIWGKILREWLEEMIPSDLDMDSIRNLQISLTPSLGMSKLVSDFTHREDLLDALLASCHIPLILDGRPLATYKGEKVLDGSFWYFVTKNRFVSLPLPESVEGDEVMWVDYGDDAEFMASLTGSFVSLITPEDMYSMIGKGYAYMQREHQAGRILLPTTTMKKKRTSSSPSSAPKGQSMSYIQGVLAAKDILVGLPEELLKMPKKIRLPKQSV